MAEIDRTALRTVRAHLTSHIRDHARREAAIQAATVAGFAALDPATSSGMVAWHTALADAWDAVASGAVSPWPEGPPPVPDEMVTMTSSLANALTEFNRNMTPAPWKAGEAS
ncbi:hypothetical protein NLX83_39705 [Allokutzneria sp. A3M-2-11 16]|uniref:hypothetical protein n=1 Tax=Allokutzneria sp. A3M-2-11 16 TaxID=2962043 RepID=UPI0020B6D25D|nr:hypothetical protein [Allokutzneria sp. A3M-2-11 16]MCP3805411.1 hypothetical protein [Allokutzneria sp. A3M-2-11 16]